MKPRILRKIADVLLPEFMRRRKADPFAVTRSDVWMPRDFNNRNAVFQVQQRCLQVAYRDLLARGGKLPSFRDVCFRAYSQNREDGILLFVFALIGVETYRCVEICAGDGIQCNTANLIINHGWEGVLFDGNP